MRKATQGFFYIEADGVVIANLTLKNANCNGDGGAIYFCSSGSVENCNFTNNTASGSGGAIYFEDGSTGNVTNCNFTNNTAEAGGAVLFNGICNVTNCNFVNNSAISYGGGAVLFCDEGTVTNCNFIDNKATGDNSFGGAIYFDDESTGNVTNCNFTGNYAPTGSAIYFYSTSVNNTISNSCFLNNRANAEALEITQNENNITITFTGYDNLLNAIYSESDVSFTNVTYWGANGIANTGSSPTILPRSNKEAGQNISVIIVVNDILTLNETKVTDEKGTIVLDLVAGNSTVTARHNADSYYTQAEKTETFNITGNETSLELAALEFTVTATISPDDAVGNITFTVTNESGIVKTLKTALSNGTANLDLSELLEGEYNITATYTGNIHYYPAKANMSYQKVNNDVIIDVFVADITYGEDVIVEITGSVDGDYTVTVNGVTKDVVLVAGEASSVNFGVLNAGTYEVIVSYVGDGDYNESSVETTVKVNRATPTISVTADNIKYGEDLVVNVMLPGDVAHRAIVTVGNETKYASLTDGVGSVKFRGLAVGTYTVVASYNGDGNYLKSSSSTTVKVNKCVADIKITANAIACGEDLIVNLTLPSDVKYRVNVTVGSISKLVSLKNGVGSVKFSGLAVGTYNITASYSGDTKYLKSSAKTTVKVTKPAVSIQLAVEEVPYGEDLVVNLTLPSNVMYRVNVSVGGMSKLVSLKNGVGSVKFSGLAMGTYTVTANMVVMLITANLLQVRLLK